MAQPEPNRQAEIREVLINAVEVQLAALKAAVGFWGEWMERTSAFVKTASKSLSTIRSADKDAGQVLLEVVDAGRESMRTMTDLPKKAAERFIDELDRDRKDAEGWGEQRAARNVGQGCQDHREGRGETCPEAPCACEAVDRSPGSWPT